MATVYIANFSTFGNLQYYQDRDLGGENLANERISCGQVQRINVGENSYELMDTLMALSHSLEQRHVLFLCFHTHTDVPSSTLL